MPRPTTRIVSPEDLHAMFSIDTFVVYLRLRPRGGLESRGRKWARRRSDAKRIRFWPAAGCDSGIAAWKMVENGEGRGCIVAGLRTLTLALPRSSRLRAGLRREWELTAGHAGGPE